MIGIILAGMGLLLLGGWVISAWRDARQGHWVMPPDVPDLGAKPSRFWQRR